MEEEKDTMSRLNIIRLVASGRIKEEDVDLTEEEKRLVEEYKKTDKLFDETGLPVSWSTPID